jgi:hypothetical protein
MIENKTSCGLTEPNLGICNESACYNQKKSVTVKPFIPTPRLSDFIGSAKFLALVVFNINYAFSAVISGNFLCCIIFFSKFPQDILRLLFRFHVPNAHAIFRNTVPDAFVRRCIKKNRKLFSDRRQEKNPKSKHKHPLLFAEKHALT